MASSDTGRCSWAAHWVPLACALSRQICKTVNVQEQSETGEGWGWVGKQPASLLLRGIVLKCFSDSLQWEGAPVTHHRSCENALHVRFLPAEPHFLAAPPGACHHPPNKGFAPRSCLHLYIHHRRVTNAEHNVDLTQPIHVVWSSDPSGHPAVLRTASRIPRGAHMARSPARASSKNTEGNCR